ncbi:MAG TPA: helicase C-terminal domain-containing protein [Bacillota bacterium]|nr:helicase C-terminal domain-containing protein [Bacillota bacterium]
MTKEEVMQLFAEDGRLAQVVPQFYPRPAQVRMASIISDVILQGLTGIIEAGTGTGKSLAYLIPALALLPEDARLVISTQTIHLQQQIMNKDLPFVEKALANPPKATLLLGRQNYLCRRKLHECFRDDPSLTPEERRFLMQVNDSAQRGLGNRQELSSVADPELWSLIGSESETCLKNRCPWNSSCFWQQARKAAFEAKVIIVNHHLFFSDLALRMRMEWDTERSLLPPYQFAIFDEAHHLENVATEYLGTHWSERDFNRLIDRLLRKDGHRRKGWLPSLRNRLLERVTELSSLQNELALINDQILPNLLTLEQRVHDFARALETIIQKNHVDNEDGMVWRYKNRVDEVFPEIIPIVERMVQSLRLTESNISSLVDALEEDEPGGEDAIFLAETGKSLAELRWTLPQLMDGGNREYINWMEREKQGKISIHHVPLQIGPLFYDAFLSQVTGSAFTSATLTVEKNFDYFRGRMGIDRVHPTLRREVTLPPAFDYQQQALILGISDLPEPDAPEYIQRLSKILPEILSATNGRAFVLFTNRYQMKAVYEAIEDEMSRQGMTMLCQGKTTRQRLLQRFKSAKSPILFGMDSFWEGVDVPGDQLSCVILTRLPFRVPTEPVQEARVEALRQTGADAFRQFSLAQAILRFKQGFGRLIRRREDYGVVVVLDSRIATKRYGRDFLCSLPGGTIKILASRLIKEAIVSWWKL